MRSKRFATPCYPKANTACSTERAVVVSQGGQSGRKEPISASEDVRSINNPWNQSLNRRSDGKKAEVYGIRRKLAEIRGMSPEVGGI